MKLLTIEIYPSVQIDIEEVSVDLESRAGSKVRMQFLDPLVRTLAQLARRPSIGRRYESSSGLMVRRWRIVGFPSYMIFYRARESLQVLRVLHGARDIDRLLDP